jgi:hypothetical protein
VRRQGLERDVTAALLGFAANDQEASFAWIALGSAAVFGLLDARYLALERAYITLYNAATATTAPDTWNLSPPRPNVGAILKALFSWSVASVHVVTIVAALGVALFG